MLLSSRDFDWVKGKGVSSLERLDEANFPREFDMRSERSGKVLRFTIDGAEMEAHEFFDGEGTAYRSSDGSVSVHLWH